MDSTNKRKSKSDFRVYVATSFPNATFCEIERVARDCELPNAQLVRELFLRGLAAYYRDGQVHEEPIGNLMEGASRFASGDTVQRAAESLQSSPELRLAQTS